MSKRVFTVPRRSEFRFPVWKGCSWIVIDVLGLKRTKTLCLSGDQCGATCVTNIRLAVASSMPSVLLKAFHIVIRASVVCILWGIFTEDTADGFLPRWHDIATAKEASTAFCSDSGSYRDKKDMLTWTLLWERSMVECLSERFQPRFMLATRVYHVWSATLSLLVWCCLKHGWTLSALSYTSWKCLEDLMPAERS